ncbi:chemotaxis response regulator protein-glutamate methylesterase [Paenibacillus sp. M1]|uniref:Protein-glutamate methylesterase/protein-glutamine glutaminase n=1 Tax=Paenibacillus haidiansis TaxID=1574488 RepID=A0ABU7VPF0_9BACL
MPYRVMVVDDSAFMRKIVSDLIEQDPDFKVEGTARNGREAVELIEKLSPDLVTLDVEMPELNGLDALKVIMKRHPLPVIMLSGINEQGMRETIMALELGAFDFIRKPSASTSSHDIEQVGKELREQMRAAMAAKERREARIAALEAKRPERLPPATGGGGGTKPPALRPDAANSGRAQPKSAAKLPSGAGNGDSRLKRSAAPEISKPRPAAGTRPGSSGSPAAAAEAGPAKPPREAKPPERRAIPPAEATSAAAGANKPVKRLGKLPQANGASEGMAAPPQRQKPSADTRRTSFTDLVAIGTSTGGPKALKAVLEKLPGSFPAPIVIVQHMPPNFTKSLAQRLNSLSELTVVEAEDGMRLQAGTAYVAPGGRHLNVVPASDGTFKLSLTDQEPRNGHRPSVDVLFDSLLPLGMLKRHAVLLTGMGSDGARSMKRLRDAGAVSTIAESEETCVVYGMPRSAVELGCVGQILPLYEIGSRLAQVVK